MSKRRQSQLLLTQSSSANSSHSECKENTATSSASYRSTAEQQEPKVETSKSYNRSTAASRSRDRQSVGGANTKDQSSRAAKRPSSSSQQHTLHDMWGSTAPLNTSSSSVEAPRASSSASDIASGGELDIGGSQINPPPAKRLSAFDPSSGSRFYSDDSPHPNPMGNTKVSKMQKATGGIRSGPLSHMNRQHPRQNAQTKDTALNPSFRMKSSRHYTTSRETPRLPHSAWGSSGEVWNVMCWKETQYTRCNGWEGSGRHAKHPQIQPKMRTILVDWLAEVCDVYRMQRSTYHLAVDLLDRYLTHATVEVKKNELQLFGVSALFTASKIEEIYPPKLADFSYVTDGACSDQLILTTEMLILKRLNWAMAPTTAVTWLATYMQIEACQDAIYEQLHKNTGGVESVPVTARRSLFEGKPSQMDTSEGDSTIGNENRVAGSRSTSSSKPDLFTAPTFDREIFVQLCQLLDLCMLDVKFLSFEYSKIAATALYFMCEQPRLALCLSGYKTAELAKCIAWMRPFAMVIAEELPVHTPYFDNVIDKEFHNIQPHTTNVTPMYAAVQKRRGLEEERARGKRNTMTFPTPPAVNSL